jgi:uncharacterized membrane protein
MKRYIIIGIIALLIISGICGYIYAQENNMTEKIPENTLETFKIDNNVIHLMHINVPTQYQYDI